MCLYNELVNLILSNDFCVLLYSIFIMSFSTILYYLLILAPSIYTEMVVIFTMLIYILDRFYINEYKMIMFFVLIVCIEITAMFFIFLIFWSISYFLHLIRQFIFKFQEDGMDILPSLRPILKDVEFIYVSGSPDDPDDKERRRKEKQKYRDVMNLIWYSAIIVVIYLAYTGKI